MTPAATLAVVSSRDTAPHVDAVANRQREALYLLSEQLHRTNSPAETFAAALDSIESALACERSAILLTDAAGVMRFVAARGLSDAYLAAVTGHSPWRHDAADPSPIHIADVAEAGIDPELKATVLGEGIRALNFIPLVADGKLIGKFMAYFDAPYASTKEDLAVSLIIARQLTLAIQRDRTMQQLRDREAQLADELAATRKIQELALEMAHEIDIERLYDKLVDSAMSIMRSDFASMQQFYPHLGAHGELKLLAHRNFPEEAARFWAWVRANSSCTCGVAIKRRERVIAADVANTAFMAGTTDQTQLLAAGILAAQSTPLMSRRGELVGMITTHWTKCHEPTQRDLRLLDIVARLAADLIERKMQDEEARRREERLRVLTQLLTDVPWQAKNDGAFAELQIAWENYTGQSWEQHAGHGWFDAIHPDDRAAVQTSWASATFNANEYECRCRLWHAPSGQHRHCLIRATPIRNEDGSVREWVGSCTEVAATPTP